MRDRRWRNRALIGFGLAAIGLGTYWGIFAWSLELAGEVIGKVSAAEHDRACYFAYLILIVFGALPGQLAFAPITMRLGRRPTFALYHVGALITVPIAFLLASSYIQAVVLLTISALFTAGMQSGYAIYFPEMFPTRLAPPERASVSTSAGWARPCCCWSAAKSAAASSVFIRGLACDARSRPCRCCSSSA